MVKEKKSVEKWPVRATYVYPNGVRAGKFPVFKENVEAAEAAGVKVEVE